MAQFVFGPAPQVTIGRQGLTYGTGGGPPAGFGFLVLNGSPLTLGSSNLMMANNG